MNLFIAIFHGFLHFFAIILALSYNLMHLSSCFISWYAVDRPMNSSFDNFYETMLFLFIFIICLLFYAFMPLLNLHNSHKPHLLLIKIAWMIVWSVFRNEQKNYGFLFIQIIWFYYDSWYYINWIEILMTTNFLNLIIK